MIINRPTNINYKNEYEKLYKLYLIKNRSDYEGSIRKYECVINNERGLFKERLSTQSKDHIMEQVVYEIARILNVPCCKNSCRKVENGVYGSFSRFETVNMNNIIPYSNIVGVTDLSADQLIVDAINRSGGTTNFVLQLYQYLIFDYIFGQQDRHLDNLSIYRAAHETLWYPLYDNGYCCFATYSNDAAIQALHNGFYQSRLGNDEDIFRALYKYRDIIFKDDIRNILNYNKINKETLLKAFNKSNKYNQLTNERMDASITFILNNIVDIHALNTRSIQI